IAAPKGHFEQTPQGRAWARASPSPTVGPSGDRGPGSSRRDAAAALIACAGDPGAGERVASEVADAARAPPPRKAGNVTAPRHMIALAACSRAFAATLAFAARAFGTGAIWPECTSGSLTETCQESRWYAGPVAVVWHASPAPEETSPCLLGIEYLIETDSVRNLLCSARWRESGTDRREVTVHVEVSTPTAEV